MGKSKGYRARTRSVLGRGPRERGKTGLSRILHQYQPGEKVVVELDPGVHKGVPHRRYQGRVGVVVGRRGRAYVVGVTQGRAVKEIIVRPEHLKPHGEA